MQPYSNVLQMEEQRKQEPIIPKSEPFTFDEYETFKRKNVKFHYMKMNLSSSGICTLNCKIAVETWGGWRIIRQISNF